MRFGPIIDGLEQIESYRYKILTRKISSSQTSQEVSGLMNSVREAVKNFNNVNSFLQTFGPEIAAKYSNLKEFIKVMGEFLKDYEQYIDQVKASRPIKNIISRFKDKLSNTDAAKFFSTINNALQTILIDMNSSIKRYLR